MLGAPTPKDQKYILLAWFLHWPSWCSWELARTLLIWLAFKPQNLSKVVRQRKQKLSLQNTAFCNCCSRRTSTGFNSLPQFPRFPLGPPCTMTPILATKKKNGLHFLTRATFTEAPAKTESNGFQTFISHLKFSTLYFISDLCFSFRLRWFTLRWTKR